jgi:ABC-type sugar transport system ATPase subunit
MALDVQGISYKYPQGNAVLEDVSLHVDDGELVALIGPSGCGKSTILHCIAGLIEIDFGKISVDGECVNSSKPHERNIGIMMQDQPLYEHLSVEQNIGFPMQSRNDEKSTISQHVKYTLHSLELLNLAKQNVSKLSGGERRRVALGRAMILKPRVLLLDEPLVSLDEELRSSLQQLIRTVHDATGASTLIVTHDKTEADSFVDRIIEL